MTDEAWAKGMGDLVLALERRNLSPDEAAARGEVYRRHLNHLSDDEWFRAVDSAIGREESFPAVAALLRYANPPEPAAATAAETFEQILGLFEAGHHLDIREVHDRFGMMAMRSFMAAGGTRRFEQCGTEERAQWTRKAFITTWEEQSESVRPDRDALPEGEAKAILSDISRKLPAAGYDPESGPTKHID